MSDMNQDHADLIEAQGKYSADDEDDHWQSEYEQWLEREYYRERCQRERKKEGKF